MKKLKLLWCDFGDIIKVVGISLLIGCLCAFFFWSTLYETAAASVDVPQHCEIVAETVLNHDDTIYYLRDVKSDVMYMYHDGYRVSGLSVMLSADGAPLLYSEWSGGAAE